MISLTPTYYPLIPTTTTPSRCPVCGAYLESTWDGYESATICPDCGREF